MQEYSQLHSLPSPRLLITIPSHFLNFPPLNLYMQEYSQLHSLPSPRLLVTIPSHFLNFPPPNLTCKSILNFTVSPLQDFLSRFQVIFKTSPWGAESRRTLFCVELFLHTLNLGLCWQTKQLQIGIAMAKHDVLVLPSMDSTTRWNDFVLWGNVSTDKTLTSDMKLIRCQLIFLTPRSKTILRFHAVSTST